MASSPWTCPYCNHDTTITAEDVEDGSIFLKIKNAEGCLRLDVRFTVCPNEACEKTALDATLVEVERVGNAWQDRPVLKAWRLLPPSNAKPYPDYIPAPLREDYEEACCILDGSPKAAATLARRCLQGILRNFYEATGRTLKDEIEGLRDTMDPLLWEAIDGVRKIGNIGAHMEKDIDVIIEVEPQEAELLVWLIEMLFRDCYIARHKKKETLRKITEAAEAKKPPTDAQPGE